VKFRPNVVQLLGVIVIIFAVLFIFAVIDARSAPTINPALQQDDYYQDLYAISDTVCCHASHWDVIVPDLTHAGKWTVYPYGSRSSKADGINVKVTMAASDNGWSETFFIPIDSTGGYKNELITHRWFNTAVDTIAVQGEFSTCAADSVLSYQFIMQGW
jgi:hypothetical protein